MSTNSSTKNKISFCKHCNKEFVPKNYGCIDFCCLSCSAKYNNIERSKNGFTTKNKTKKAVCVICGDETDISLNASIKTAKCKKCLKLNNKKENIKIQKLRIKSLFI